MLTRDLLEFSTRKGRIRPRYVSPGDAGLGALAGDLVRVAQEHEGATAGELEEQLGALARGASRPRVARGLVKLILDKAETEAPDAGAPARRAEAFSAAAAVLRGLGSKASRDDYEDALRAALGSSLESVREGLYCDLPSERRVTRAVTWSPRELLDRYNLALAQGLVMYAVRLELRVGEADAAALRRILRWLKFCRLVADVNRDGEAVTIAVEGPARVVDGAKRYGMQLATFLGAVPLLECFWARAEVKLPRRKSAVFELSHEDGLVSPLTAGRGHVPDEVRAFARALEDAGYEVVLAPGLRRVGATGLAVPDLELSRDGGRERRVVELFHAWHAGPLATRLDQLEEAPDPGFVLGVERRLLKEPALACRLDARPGVFFYRDLPTVRSLMKVITSS